MISLDKEASVLVDDRFEGTCARIVHLDKSLTRDYLTAPPNACTLQHPKLLLPVTSISYRKKMDIRHNLHRHIIP